MGSEPEAGDVVDFAVVDDADMVGVAWARGDRVRELAEEGR